MAPATRKSRKSANDPDTPTSLEFPDGLTTPTTARRRRVPQPQTACLVNSGLEKISGLEPPIPHPLTPTPALPDFTPSAEVPPPKTSTRVFKAPQEPTPLAKPFVAPCPHTVNLANTSNEIITTGAESPPTSSAFTTRPTTPTAPKELPPPPADHLPTRTSATPWYRSTTFIIPLLGLLAIVGWLFAAIIYAHEQCVTVPRLTGSSRGRAAMRSCWR
ncbi:MAG: hypothetical protein Q9216_006764 [Gyalolechia sp. 2 TL-2023]